jgi:hypothetical protein
VQARLQVALRRKWTARSEDFIDDIARNSGLTINAVGERAAEDDELGDLLAASLVRATGVSSPSYRSDLAALVGRAFDDEALIEPVAYLTSIVLNLEPADLRVLRALSSAQGSKAMKGLEPHTYPRGVQVMGRELTPELSMDLFLVLAALERLEACGFAYTTPQNDRRMGQARFGERDDRLWSATPLGARVLELCGDR